MTLHSLCRREAPTITNRQRNLAHRINLSQLRYFGRQLKQSRDPELHIRDLRQHCFRHRHPSPITKVTQLPAKRYDFGNYAESCCIPGRSQFSVMLTL